MSIGRTGGGVDHDLALATHQPDMCIQINAQGRELCLNTGYGSLGSLLVKIGLHILVGQVDTFLIEGSVRVALSSISLEVSVEIPTKLKMANAI